MPAFSTPEPILVEVDLAAGNVRIAASARTDTVVEVRPTDPANPSDVEAAELTVVELSGGTLSVRGPKLRPFGFINDTRSVDVTVELPEGSRVEGGTGAGDLRGIGRLGACRYKTGAGHVELDHSAELHLRTGAGNVRVGRVDGKAEITTSSGRVQVGELAGGGEVKNSNGSTVIGAAGGALRVKSANGDITVERAEAGVTAKTANGSVRVLDAVRGDLALDSAMGDIGIGIHEGTAAWLDVHTRFGRVHNELDERAAPEGASNRLAARASTSFGDIRVHRA